MIRGPDATAGSIFILLKNIGITVLTILEMTIAAISETPTQPEIANAPNQPYPLNK